MAVSRFPFSPDGSGDANHTRVREPARSPIEVDVFRIRRLVDKGEYIKAYNILEKMEHGTDSTGIKLQKLHATVLSRLGMPEHALRLMESLRETTTGNDWELEALTGSLHKKLWLSGRKRDRKTAHTHLEKSRRYYTRARELGGDFWCGINSASLAKILGDDSAAVKEAETVTEECWAVYLKNLTTSSFWIPATMGEACLVRGDFNSAIKWYKAARSHVGGNLGWLQSARLNASLLIEAVGPDPETANNLLDALPRMRIALFAGHKLDNRGRISTRFPERISEKVRLKLRKELAGLHPDIGIASAAHGADILFHESMHEMGKRTSVILPYHEDSFRITLRDAAGEAWAARFDAVIERADRVEVACTGRFESCQDYVHGFCSDYMLATALDMAAVNDAELTPVVLWDGKTERKPGGTADMVAKLRYLGLAPKWVRLPEIDDGGGFCLVSEKADVESIYPSNPAIRPVVVVFNHFLSDSEEERISGMNRILIRTEESYRYNECPFLKSAVFPEGFSLVFGNLEDTWAFASDFIRNRDGNDRFSLIIHAGVLVNLSSAVSGIRDYYYREIEEALSVCRTLRSPAILCTMQARALSDPKKSMEENFQYQGTFMLENGTSLQLFRCSPENIHV